MRRTLSACLVTLLLLAGCTGNERAEVLTHPQPLPSYTDGIRINAWFSQTSGNYHEGGGIDQLLVDDIESAESEILLAIYAVTNDRLRDALIQAHERGVDVQIVTDDGEYEDEDMKRLRQSGIVVHHDDDRYALMHDKFLVIDDRVVWSGSCNYTYYAFYRNNENLVKITSQKIAAVYKVEFEELLQRRYIENPFISETIEIYFSPEDNFKQRLLQLIAGAKERIDFLAFAFTDEAIAKALIAKKEAGVSVRGVIDEKQNSYQKYSEYAYLKSQGIEVYLDANPFTLHDKVMIIDDTVVTGSYNFTQKANDTNNENSIVVHNGAFAQKYLSEFEKIFTLARSAGKE